MAEGDGTSRQMIRVRLGETASDADVGALKSWLEREKPLEELVRAGRLRIQEQPRESEHGSPMGAGMDIMLKLVEVGAAELFRHVLTQVQQAVDAWRANRCEVESGDTPPTSVDAVDPRTR